MKKKLLIGAVALVMIVAAAACSTEHTKQASGEKVDTLKIAGTSTPSFTRNFNAFSPASTKAPGISYFYEPLVRTDRTDSNKVKPWLAKSFKYSDHGKTLTFKLRDDVTWSDGKPLTSADVKYTLELPSKKDGLGAAPLPDLKSVTTPDKHTAVVHYSKPQLHDLANYASAGGTRLIVPAHIWKKRNPKKWTNKTPVGTGPYTLESFSTQSIKLKVRDDYWGGKFHGVEHVDIKAFGSENSGKQMILKNQVSWGGMAWKDYDKDFVDKAPDQNHYWTYPTGGSTGVLFNMKKAPTDNVHIRRALNAALDTENLLKLYDSGINSANPTGLDGEVWAAYMSKELRKSHVKQDTDKAKAELKKSGYKVKDGKLTKSGKSYPLSLKTNADYGSWTSYAPGMKRQWNEVLGLNVSVKKSPTDQLAEYQQNGDFEMTQDYVVGGDDIWNSLYSQLSSNYIKPLGTRSNGNYGRYKNPDVDKLLEKMSGTREQDDLKKYVTAIQKIILKDVPYAPLHNAASYIEVNGHDWKGWPDRDEATYVPHHQEGPDATLTIQNLRPNATKKK